MKKLKLKRPVPSESSEQATVIDWARTWGAKLDGLDMLHSIPNGAVLGNPHYNRFALIGKLKAEGLKPGVSDLFLAVARGGYFGWYGEGKRRSGGKLSEAQEYWLKRAREEGYKAEVWEGAEHCIELITKYLKLPPT